MSELCEVVITAPDPDWLYSFARELVKDGLAASTHNFTPIRSIYRWQGQVHERAEGRVSLHTSRGRIAEIVARAQREHPYEISGVSARPIHRRQPGLPRLDCQRDRPHKRADVRAGPLTRVGTASRPQPNRPSSRRRTDTSTSATVLPPC